MDISHADQPCCSTTPLRLTPQTALCEITSRTTLADHWDLGLDTWHVRIGAAFDVDELTSALSTHLGADLDEPGVLQAAADHGMHVLHGHHTDGPEAWVGNLEIVMARFDDPYAAAAGRQLIDSGADLILAADDAAEDLVTLVSAIASASDNDDRLAPDVLALFPSAELVDSVLMVRSAHITPALRGNGLSSWAVAQAIATLQPPDCLVALHAAPMSRADAGVPEDNGREMTGPEMIRWRAEQDRLAAQWAAQLGLTPLPSRPDVLVWFTVYRNEALEHAAGRYT